MSVFIQSDGLVMLGEPDLWQVVEAYHGGEDAGLCDDPTGKMLSHLSEVLLSVKSPSEVKKLVSQIALLRHFLPSLTVLLACLINAGSFSLEEETFHASLLQVLLYFSGFKVRTNENNHIYLNLSLYVVTML